MARILLYQHNNYYAQPVTGFKEAEVSYTACNTTIVMFD